MCSGRVTQYWARCAVEEPVAHAVDLFSDFETPAAPSPSAATVPGKFVPGHGSFAHVAGLIVRSRVPLQLVRRHASGGNSHQDFAGPWHGRGDVGLDQFDLSTRDIAKLSRLNS